MVLIHNSYFGVFKGGIFLINVLLLSVNIIICGEGEKKATSKVKIVVLFISCLLNLCIKSIIFSSACSCSVLLTASIISMQEHAENTEPSALSVSLSVSLSQTLEEVV